jgi:hypothetical protein
MRIIIEGYLNAERLTQAPSPDTFQTIYLETLCKQIIKNAQEKSAQQEMQQQEQAKIDVENQRLADIELQKQQALALEEEQAARKSQANLPLPLPGIEEAVGPSMQPEATAETTESAPPEQVPAGQQSLFGATGKPTPEALSSVKVAQEQQAQATAEQSRQTKLAEANEKLATPEGTKEVLGTLNTPNSYFEGYSKADQNRIRTQLQRRLEAFKSKDLDLQAQRQKELEETSGSGGVAGYETPMAFGKLNPSVLGQGGMESIGLSSTKKKKKKLKKIV